MQRCGLNMLLGRGLATHSSRELATYSSQGLATHSSHMTLEIATCPCWQYHNKKMARSVAASSASVRNKSDVSEGAFVLVMYSLQVYGQLLECFNKVQTGTEISL
jgi:hypothetical protein